MTVVQEEDNKQVPSAKNTSSNASGSNYTATRPKCVLNWSVLDVQKWFRRHCGDYYHLYSEAILEQDITGKSLIRLNENSLLRLGIVHPEHRQAILREIAKKYQSPVRVYKYPFELLMRAYEMRFPTCDMIPIVRETEILEESENEDGSVQIIDRRAKLEVDVPYLLKKFMGVDCLLFRQKNTLDRSRRTLSIDAWNESFANRIIINEFCVYSVHPENPDWTCFEQSAELDIKNFFGFEGTAEKLAIKEYSKSIGKSKDIMEHHIGVLAVEGITSVPIWEAKEVKPSKKPTEAVEEKASSPVPDSLEPQQQPQIQQPQQQTVSSEDKHPPEKTMLRRKSSVFRMDGGGSAASEAHEDVVAKLEQDYIQMYLGELSPIQESQLVQLKMCISELLKGKVPSDPVLLRFLRARDFNVEKAREMLSQSLVWRKKHGVDRILSEYELPEVLRKYFPGGWHYHDAENRPLFILRLGQVDVKGIVKSIGEDGLTKLTLSICEEGLRLTEEASHWHGHPISTWCLLLDLEGLNMRHLWRPGMKALLHLIEICEANYPETLGRVLIVRAPRVFPIMWTLVSPLINDTSRSKILFHGGSDTSQTGLTDYIQKEHLPVWLGGENTESFFPKDGGLVPKSYYMSEEDYESPGPRFLEESTYHSASLSRGQVHEGTVRIAERGSVITWDFDVMKQDVVFSVFRLKASPVNPPATGGEPENNHESSSSEHRSSLIEKTWKEGRDYFRVENPIVCHDGESIQGSHVTAFPGTYVLQWKFFEKASSGGPLDVIDSITAHKAKVMYYYETLNSLDYRGSMTSLQSRTSGFSTLSSKASHQSTSGVSSGVPSSVSDKIKV